MATKAKTKPETKTEAVKPAPKKAEPKPEQEVVVLGKTELVAAIAEKMQGSKKDASEALRVVLETIEETLKLGHSIRLIPFGSFEIRERKGRTGRNPRTGDQIDISARKVPAFKPGKALRDAVS